MHGKKKELENARKEAFLTEDCEKENPNHLIKQLKEIKKQIDDHLPAHIHALN